MSSMAEEASRGTTFETKKALYASASEAILWVLTPVSCDPAKRTESAHYLLKKPQHVDNKTAFSIFVENDTL